MELGTRTHPYKSSRSMFSELLNHHSNQDKTITIYIAENQNFYIEDDFNYILNITNVTITSYSDISDTPGKAILTPTEIQQLSMSKKTKFSLLSNTDLRLTEVINNSSYTDSEKASLDILQVTFHILRSNVYFDNIDITREVVDYGKETTLINLIYLQDRTLQMTNVDLNITGILMNNAYPFNGLFENMTIDTYGLRNGFYSLID